VRARVIGLGQRAGGDDGVGLAVIEALRLRGVPAGVELAAVAEASALVPLLSTAAQVVVVDAVLAAPPGEVVELSPGDLAAGRAAAVSTHGLGVGQAIELAALTSPGGVSPDIRLVAVTIDRPGRAALELSPAVRAAVPRAVERVLAIVGG
jgi:hydrogenase maturation protease